MLNQNTTDVIMEIMLYFRWTPFASHNHISNADDGRMRQYTEQPELTLYPDVLSTRTLVIMHQCEGNINDSQTYHY